MNDKIEINWSERPFHYVLNKLLTKIEECANTLVKRKTIEKDNENRRRKNVNANDLEDGSNLCHYGFYMKHLKKLLEEIYTNKIDFSYYHYLQNKKKLLRLRRDVQEYRVVHEDDPSKFDSWISIDFIGKSSRANTVHIINLTTSQIFLKPLLKLKSKFVKKCFKGDLPPTTIEDMQIETEMEKKTEDFVDPILSKLAISDIPEFIGLNVMGYTIRHALIRSGNKLRRTSFMSLTVASDIGAVSRGHLAAIADRICNILRSRPELPM
uniref:DUF4806 domain-containing protein n=1 Tax=Strongyloides papillosus TaxID=174720 RepID=A0A0N5B485_STREA